MRITSLLTSAALVLASINAAHIEKRELFVSALREGLKMIRKFDDIDYPMIKVRVIEDVVGFTDGDEKKSKSLLDQILNGAGNFDPHYVPPVEESSLGKRDLFDGNLKRGLKLIRRLDDVHYPMIKTRVIEDAVAFANGNEKRAKAYLDLIKAGDGNFVSAKVQE